MWTVGAGGYTALVGEKSLSGRIVRWGATPLLIWQLGCGIAYVTKVLETGQFFF